MTQKSQSSTHTINHIARRFTAISLPSLALLALLQAASATGFAAPAAPFEFRNPVRAGDYPDPSVIRVGKEYWATATSSEWAPHFPLLFSRDLVNWELRGQVFDTPPKWAKGSFWAPEIAEDRGKFFIYYTARRQDGRLAVAVATAPKPAGPWTDHGELVAQEAGSIDGVPYTDANGVRWLLWKEDGNSRKLPTPIWIQRLSDDGLKLVGERREILRNDAPWEGAVVEGPFLLRQGAYYYLFYSGAGCCGKGCNYALGVARAKDMLGPWEKCPVNPILKDNEAWRCPGHGSIVTDPEGRHWLLYHAYARQGFVATGRQMLLDEVVFGSDGWPSINRDRGPSTRAPAPAAARHQTDVTAWHEDYSRGGRLPSGWQWPIGARPAMRIGDGLLTLTVGKEGPAAVVRSITVPTFAAETGVAVTRLKGDAFAGLAAYGDRANHLAVVTDGKTIQVWLVRKGERQVLAQRPAPAAAEWIRLRLTCQDGNRFGFAAQAADGAWSPFEGPTDGSFLPPWDRGVRAGHYVAGSAGASGGFDAFVLAPASPAAARTGPASAAAGR